MARKVAIVGCGTIAKTHLDAINGNPGFELVAGCDIDISRAKETRAPRTYGSLEALFIGEKNLPDTPDLIVIATPSGLHYEMAVACIQNGYDCLVEKPVAFTAGEVRYLETLMSRSGKKIYPVLQVRHNPSLLALKENFEKLGKIATASLEVFWQRTQAYYDNSSWRGTRNMEGGALLDQGIHYIDALQWLLGAVRVATGVISTAAHFIEIEDTAVGLVQFESGALATINFSDCAYKMNRQCRLTVVGETGYVELGGKALEKIIEWDILGMDAKPTIREVEPNIYDSGKYTGSCPNHPQVYQSILDRTCPLVSEALPSISIIESIYEADLLGKIKL